MKNGRKKSLRNQAEKDALQVTSHWQNGDLSFY